METFDLLLLTVPLVILFILFGISTIKEFSNMSENKYTGDKKMGGAASLLNFLGKFFTAKPE